jgi:hypothetical protein
MLSGVLHHGPVGRAVIHQSIHPQGGVLHATPSKVEAEPPLEAVAVCNLAS